MQRLGISNIPFENFKTPNHAAYIVQTNLPTSDYENWCFLSSYKECTS